MAIQTDHVTNTLIASKGYLNIGNSANVSGNLTANSIVTSGSINSALIRTNTISVGGYYNLSNTDSGLTLFFSNVMSTFVNVGNTLPVGFRVIATKLNGDVTFISQSPDVIINTRTGVLNQIAATYGSASLVCYAPHSFILDGAIQ